MENLGYPKFASHQLLDLPGTIHAPVADLNSAARTWTSLPSSPRTREEVHAFTNDGEGHFRDRVLNGSTNKDFSWWRWLWLRT